MRMKMNGRGRNQSSNLVELSLWNVICMLLHLVWHVFMLFIKKIIRPVVVVVVLEDIINCWLFVRLFFLFSYLCTALTPTTFLFRFFWVYIFASHNCNDIMGCNLITASVIRYSDDERTTSSIFFTLSLGSLNPKRITIDPKVFSIKLGPSSRTVDPK